MTTAAALLHVIEVTYVVVIVLLLWELLPRRWGLSGSGWGAIGLLLVLCAVGSASLCAIDLRILSVPGQAADPGTAAELDIIGFVASIASGGLGTGLLTYWLTSIRPAVATPVRDAKTRVWK